MIPNFCYLIGSLTHSLVKIITLDHFDVNINGIISNLEYWGESCFIIVFSAGTAMKHFYGSISISWVDFGVVLMSYLFQSVRVDLEGELEKCTKYAQIWKYSKSMFLDFGSLHQRKNSSPTPCVIHIRKHLDLPFHLVYAELVF